MAMQKQFKVAIYQFSPILGDFKANSQKIIAAIKQAKEQQINLLVLGEMCLSGYPTGDFINNPLFALNEERYLQNIVSEVTGSLAVVMGSFTPTSSTKTYANFYNRVLFIAQGTIVYSQNKQLLAGDGVFYDPRYFTAGVGEQVVEWQGIKLGLLICEDIWHEAELGNDSPTNRLIKQGAQLLVVINASSFEVGKVEQRLKLVQTLYNYSKTPIIYANRIGLQTDIIFDGHSFMLDSDGQGHFLQGFTEQFWQGYPFQSVALKALTNFDDNEQIFAALIYGIRQFMSGFPGFKVHLGLSGGIDSALVATLASLALGANRVVCLLLPSRYSSDGSLADAKKLADNLGLQSDTINIDEAHKAIASGLSPLFTLQGLTDENVQARLRGLYLMAYSNQMGSLLLTTSNKSELAVGYGTLYGDMCGALNPIGDLYKTQVYLMCNYINQNYGQLIPQSIIDKEPSAELRPDQRDSDSLPSYNVLDKLLYAIIEEQLNYSQLLAQGYPATMVNKVLKLYGQSEFKRFQSPPILKVSAKAFGSGRLVPLNRAFFEREDG
jgi:NAD+ synthase (glutamine-hydrolysing)